MLQEGDRLSNFKLLNQDEEIVKFPSNDLLIIYFYPKADTPGCTKESCEFQTNLKKFNNLKTQIVGISKDSVAKQKKFAQKFNLKFNLLSDESTDICEKFGVWVEKSMYGKKYYGIERSTFVIGKNKKILKAWRKVKVNNHVDEVMSFIKSF
ncbi:thioredoxin-dependent thiol peroxidase [Pelagibacteraceae bacterium]|nr:thioredoxin-dependent thiol peroxidase [Pelagibacteraceae bacterium]